MNHSIQKRIAMERVYPISIPQKSTASFSYIIIGGRSANVRAIRKVLAKTYTEKAICLGYFGDLAIPRLRNLGLDKELINYIRRAKNIQRIVYVDSGLDDNELRYLMQLCRAKAIDFIVMPQEAYLFPKGIRLEEVCDIPVLFQRKEAIAQRPYQILKRVFDIVFSFIVIVFILSWMIPLVTFLIKLESSGPVFFVQTRTGYFNSHFPCLKFRSMQVNEDCDQQQATKTDYRITRVGAFLRRTNLDEFPQFINVFLGQMSVVGPRPHMLKHTREYSKIINEFMVRHSVKPGVTGWAQVNGHRGPTETVEKMRIRVEHDIWYIKNWSFFLDIKCVFMTILNFIKGEENAF